MGRRLICANLMAFCLIWTGSTVGAFAQNQDARKDATAATKAANSKLLDELPFSDKSDFDSARKGLIAPLPPR